MKKTVLWDSSAVLALLDADDADAIKAKTEALSGHYSKIAEVLYKEASARASEEGAGQAGTSGETSGEASGEGPGAKDSATAAGEAEGAVDADYQVVDEEPENEGK